MSSRIGPPDDLELTLYRHGLSLAVLFDLLVDKGLVTRDEIRHRARVLNHHLFDDAAAPAPCSDDLVE